MGVAKQREALIKKLSALVQNNDDLVPVYRSDITNEAMASAGSHLPLIYIWNEEGSPDYLTFQLSMNNHAIAALVEQVMPRRDPEFIRICMIFSKGLAESRMKAVQETCAKIGKMPSQLFSQKISLPKPLSEKEFQNICSTVLSLILSDKNLSTPIYRSDIKTEEMANKGKDLPLFYLWNEVTVDGKMSYSMSVNTPMLVSLITPLVPRHHPSFEVVREKIISTATDAMTNSVNALCDHAKVPVSVMFGPEVLGSSTYRQG